MRRLARLAAAAVLAFLLVPPAPSDAQRRPRSSDLGTKQQDLEQTKKRLEAERRKAAAAKKREAGILAELESIDRRLTAKRKQLAVLDGRIKKAQSEVASLQAEIATLRRRQSGQEQALAQRLRTLYKLETRGGALPLLLSGDDPVAKAVQLRHLATLAAVDARLIGEYRVTSDELGDRKARLEERQKELTGLRAEVEEERADANRELAKRQKLLARVKDERAHHDRMVGELSQAAKRLEAFIRQLQEKRRKEAAAAAARAAAAKRSATKRPAPNVPLDIPSGTGFASLRGRLLWPAEGRVIAEYGPQVHPRFGTKTFRNGIDIESEEGSQFVAVAPGTVLYTGWFRGYGNLVILDHGGEYYTLYAHAATIRVGEGDQVAQGQPLGTVGDTGSLQGASLYFEVRHGGKPQDPTQWLRPRG